jgi:hypothetical protein
VSMCIAGILSPKEAKGTADAGGTGRYSEGRVYEAELMSECILMRAKNLASDLALAIKVYGKLWMEVVTAATEKHACVEGSQ